LADPIDDYIGDLEIVLAHHDHVAVALDVQRGQVLNFAVPPTPLMAATDSLQILRRSSLLGPLEPFV
jgi:hypothetical protein